MTMPPLPKTDTLDISGCFLVWNQRQMLDYAAAVRAATIEECAKVCEDLGPSASRKWAEPDNLDCADAIRALK